jgi:diacylglycerol kinase (ATP)
MIENPNEGKRQAGVGRWASAFRNTCTGFRHALRNEVAIREELLLMVVLVPVSIAVHVTKVEHLILILSMMLVLLVEFMNSAIESTIDRVSLEQHPLSARAKDLASAAVFIALLMCAVSWAVIVGPLLVTAMHG